MAQFDHRNLALTVHAIARRRLPCEVGHANDGRGWAWRHRWTDGRCRNCHLTPKETLEPPVPTREQRPPRGDDGAWAALAGCR